MSNSGEQRLGDTRVQTGILFLCIYLFILKERQSSVKQFWSDSVVSCVLWPLWVYHNKMIKRHWKKDKTTDKALVSFLIFLPFFSLVCCTRRFHSFNMLLYVTNRCVRWPQFEMFYPVIFILCAGVTTGMFMCVTAGNTFESPGGSPHISLQLFTEAAELTRAALQRIHSVERGERRERETSSHEDFSRARYLWNSSFHKHHGVYPYIFHLYCCVHAQRGNENYLRGPTREGEKGKGKGRRGVRQVWRHLYEVLSQITQGTSQRDTCSSN